MFWAEIRQTDLQSPIASAFYGKDKYFIMSTVNLAEGIRDFPQLLQSEYFSSLEEATTESKKHLTLRVFHSDSISYFSPHKICS